jgi:putative spermidine/putrescine transport system permease protein
VRFGTGRGITVANLLILVFLLAPLVVVVIASLTSAGFVRVPPSEWGVGAYAELGRQQAFIDSFYLSARTAITVSIVSPLFGLMAAWGLKRMGVTSKSVGVLEAVFLAPLAVPHVILGIGMLQGTHSLGLRPAYSVLVSAHILITLPYSVRIIGAGLRRMDPLLERAGQILGGSDWEVYSRVTLPLLRPALIAAIFIAGSVSFDDVGVSLFIADASTITLPVRIFGYLEYQFSPFIAAIGAIVILFPLGVAMIAQRIFGLGTLFGLNVEERVRRGRMAARD